MRIPAPENKKMWIGIIFLLKIIFLFFYYLMFFPLPQGQMEGLVFVNKDFAEFYLPVENFVTKGIYSFDGTESYAGRMPGYILPAMLLRFFLSRFAVLHITVLLQVMLSSAALYYMAKMLLEISGRKIIFTGTIVLFCFFSCFVNFDIAYHPNSFVISAFMLSVYFFYRYTRQNANRFLFFSGLFLAWVIFLRPYLGIYVFSFSLVLIFLLIKNKAGLQKIIAGFFFFMLPLFVFESAWVARNYFSLGRVVLTQTSFAPGEKSEEYGFNRRDKYSLQQLRNLIFAWGGDNLWYVKGSEMSWFVNNFKEQKEIVLPEYVYCKGYNLDSLKQLKKDIQLSFLPGLSDAQHDSLEDMIIRKSNRYTAFFKKEKPVRFYLVSPFYRITHLALRNVTQDWPGPSFQNSSFPYKILKLGSLSFYFISVFSGLLFLIFFPFTKTKEPLFLLSAANLAVLLLSFAYFINFAHHTYFFTGFISCFMLAVCGVITFNRKAKI